MLLSGCITNSENHYDPLIRIKYHINIDASNSTSYHIFVPIVVNKDGNFSEVMNNLSIKRGEGSFNIIETPYGKALNISGKGILSIYGMVKIPAIHDFNRYNTSIHPNGGPDFNLWSDNNTIFEFPNIGEVWIYAEITNSSDIQLQLLLTFSGLEHDVITDIQSGWQTIRISASSTATD